MVKASGKKDGASGMDLFRRHENNPIITVNDLPMQAIAVYNPGVAQVGDEIVLLLRVELADGRSSLYVARSKDGVNNWVIYPNPLLAPGDPDSPIADYEEVGCEDPRSFSPPHQRQMVHAAPPDDRQD